MAAKSYKMGPGSLVIGAAGSAQTIDCQITEAVIEWDADEEDDTPLLCGQVEPGDETHTAQISATLFQDLAENGIVDWSWKRKGETHPFEFVPSTATGRRVVGAVKVRPIDVGGEVGKKPTSEIEWPCVGEPVLEDVA